MYVSQMTSSCVFFYYYLWISFTPFSSVSFVDFEQANVSWEGNIAKVFTAVFKKLVALKNKCQQIMGDLWSGSCSTETLLKLFSATAVYPLIFRNFLNGFVENS